ncbi:MAG: hypothetical protein ACN4GT_11300 [Gammaproteobacteria bacterium]
MRTLLATIMIVAVGMAQPSLAAPQTFQLIWEMFDETRLKKTCTYGSKDGDVRIVEYSGPEFCPRVI